MSRKLTEKETERMLGRSGSYPYLKPEFQWAEDKRLGILDWDGTEEGARQILSARKGYSVMSGIKSVCYVHICNTLVFRTTFKDSLGYERDMIVTGIESLKMAKAMAKHIGWTGEVRVSE